MIIKKARAFAPATKFENKSQCEMFYALQALSTIVEIDANIQIIL